LAEEEVLGGELCHLHCLDHSRGDWLVIITATDVPIGNIVKMQEKLADGTVLCNGGGAGGPYSIPINGTIQWVEIESGGGMGLLKSRSLTCRQTTDTFILLRHVFFRKA